MREKRDVRTADALVVREAFQVEPWNVERKDVERQTDDRTCLSGIATGLESDLPTTLTPKLVQELRHTQRKPVSGRKPLRRLLPIPSRGIAHIRGTGASLQILIVLNLLSKLSITNGSKLCV